MLKSTARIKERCPVVSGYSAAVISLSEMFLVISKTNNRLDVHTLKEDHAIILVGELFQKKMRSVENACGDRMAREIRKPTNKRYPSSI